VRRDGAFFAAAVADDDTDRAVLDQQLRHGLRGHGLVVLIRELRVFMLDIREPIAVDIAGDRCPGPLIAGQGKGTQE